MERVERKLVDPKVSVSTEIVDKDGNQIISAQYQVEYKDISHMDEIKQLVGDGLARVTVSTDFGIKEYGTGASAMCSVSLTCAQDVATIEKAAKLAGEMARDIAQEQRARAEQELAMLMSQRQAGQGPNYR
jgi:hypothetical protein